MFWNRIKEFWTKKIVKKKLLNVKHLVTNDSIKKVGIVIDETYFDDKEALISELIKNGIRQENIFQLVFNNNSKKNESFDCAFFTYKNLSWIGTIDKKEVSEFIQQDFDLLISYYDTEKSPLLLVTHLSKATFKVGFASIDKRLNHFMIDITTENYEVFIFELFKYLKILNKL